MALIKCFSCGSDISDRAVACPHCGAAQGMAMNICQECGSSIPDDAAACPMCGCPIEMPLFNQPVYNQQQTKFCQNCGETIPMAAVICTKCGCQTGTLRAETPNIIINTNVNNDGNMGQYGNAKNKWVAFLLCFFAGYLGAHKFYEGKTGTGILYIFTAGLFGIGWLCDCIALLLKPNPYYV